MKKRFLSKLFSSVLAGSMVMSTLWGNLGTITAQAEESDAQTIKLTDADVESLTGDADYSRTSVHDPSVVYDNDGTYYIFGSHMGVSKSTDLENWTSVFSESEDSKLFGKIVSDESAGNSASSEADAATSSSSADEADSSTSASSEEESSSAEDSSSIEADAAKDKDTSDAANAGDSEGTIKESSDSSSTIPFSCARRFMTFIWAILARTDSFNLSSTVPESVWAIQMSFPKVFS